MNKLKNDFATETLLWKGRIWRGNLEATLYEARQLFLLLRGLPFIKSQFRSLLFLTIWYRTQPERWKTWGHPLFTRRFCCLVKALSCCAKLFLSDFLLMSKYLLQIRYFPNHHTTLFLFSLKVYVVQGWFYYFFLSFLLTLYADNWAVDKCLL